jgi:hypothetical protein
MFGRKASRIRALEAQLHTERQARRDLIAAMNGLRHQSDLAHAGESRDTPNRTVRFTEPSWLRERLHRRE